MDWDEEKRQKNLFKHGLDFAHADTVLLSDWRLDVDIFRNNQHRVQSFAYVFDYLAVLTVVHIDAKRIIKFSSCKP